MMVVGMMKGGPDTDDKFVDSLQDEEIMVSVISSLSILSLVLFLFFFSDKVVIYASSYAIWTFGVFLIISLLF